MADVFTNWTLSAPLARSSKVAEHLLNLVYRRIEVVEMSSGDSIVARHPLLEPLYLIWSPVSPSALVTLREKLLW